MLAIIIAISAVIVAILTVLNLWRGVAAHSGFEVPDAFTEAFGDLRYPSRTEQDDDNYGDD
jgi:hypothetical protein